MVCFYELFMVCPMACSYIFLWFSYELFKIGVDLPAPIHPEVRLQCVTGWLGGSLAGWLSGWLLAGWLLALKGF